MTTGAGFGPLQPHMGREIGMKKYIQSIIVISIAYLLGAFIAMDLNPEHWLVEGRASLAMVTLMFCSIVLAAP